MFGNGFLYNLALDNHFRYWSGLLLVIGILLLCNVPNIEHDDRNLCCVIVSLFIGGLGRL